MDPKLAPTPDMMHLQIASLKKEIERQRTAHEGNLEPCLPRGYAKQSVQVCLSVLSGNNVAVSLSNDRTF